MSYREEQEQQRADLRALVSGILHHLAEDGTPWDATLSSPDHTPAATFTNGVEHFAFRVSYIWDKPGRLQIRGVVPKYNDGNSVSLSYGDTMASITVSAKKSPAAIVADVKRRLFPKYEEQHAELAKRKEEHDAQADKAQAFTRELAELSGGEVRSREHNGGDPTIVRVHGEFSDRFEVRYDGEGVYLRNVSLTADQARDFAKLVAKWNV